MMSNRERCEKRVAVTPTLYNELNSQLKYHQTPNDLITEAWELYKKIHRIVINNGGTNVNDDKTDKK